jgi:hypothetical protein
MTNIAIDNAERLADRLRSANRILSDACWNLDSALSLHRKAQLGYRANPAIGDAPWDASVTLARVTRAYTLTGFAMDLAAAAIEGATLSEEASGLDPNVRYGVDLSNV